MCKQSSSGLLLLAFSDPADSPPAITQSVVYCSGSAVIGWGQSHFIREPGPMTALLYGATAREVQWGKHSGCSEEGPGVSHVVMSDGVTLHIWTGPIAS